MSNFNLAGVVSALNSGDVIVYPTDTLYGLGADIYNDEAVKKIFTLKKRGFDQPLSVAVASLEDLEDIAFVDDRVRRVAEKFLPGSLTIVLKKKNVVSDLVTAGSDTIAIRIPDNPFALRLLEVFGPLTCTSANIHGKDTSPTVDDIRKDFQDDILVYIDAGQLEGMPSTIVDLSGDEPRILREGAILGEEVLKAIK
jgi:L-threonylcarbamoyladenylate synthase